eukprot:2283896-Pyramimonas_sp.AAC.1
MGNTPSAASRRESAHNGFSRSWQEAARDQAGMGTDEHVLADPSEIVYGDGFSSPRALAQQAATVLQQFTSQAVDDFDLTSHLPKVVQDDPYVGKLVELLRRAGAKKGLDFNQDEFKGLERVHGQLPSIYDEALPLDRTQSRSQSTSAYNLDQLDEHLVRHP